VYTVTTGFNTITEQISEMSQQKNPAYYKVTKVSLLFSCKCTWRYQRFSNWRRSTSFVWAS